MPGMIDPLEQSAWPSSRLRWLLWVGFTVCWSAALLTPGGVIDATTGIENPKVHFTLAKALHVLAYAGFTALTAWLRLPFLYRWLMLLFLIGHAALGEYLQWSFPLLGRTGSVRDVLLDWTAIAIGLAASWKWWLAKPLA